mgnify:CR=1 FL=1
MRCWRSFRSDDHPSEMSAEACSKIRQEIRFEPWITPEPRRVSPGGMRQRNQSIGIIPPRGDGCGHCFSAHAFQIVRLRATSDDERKTDTGHVVEQALMPERGTFRMGRKIATTWIDSGITESHGHDGNAVFVVEGVGLDLHPVAQSVAASIVPRFATGMDLCSRCLADDQHARRLTGAQDRPRTQRQISGTDLAGLHIAQECGEHDVIRVDGWPVSGLAASAARLEPL